MLEQQSRDGFPRFGVVSDGKVGRRIVERSSEGGEVFDPVGMGGDAEVEVLVGIDDEDGGSFGDVGCEVDEESGLTSRETDRAGVVLASEMGCESTRKGSLEFSEEFEDGRSVGSDGAGVSVDLTLELEGSAVGVPGRKERRDATTNKGTEESVQCFLSDDEKVKIV